MPTTSFNPFTAANTCIQNWWQGYAAWAQTCASIMAARGNMVQLSMDNLPAQLSPLAHAKTPAELVAASQTIANSWFMQAYHLHLTTQAERGHLLHTWANLARRSMGQTPSPEPTWAPTQPAATPAKPQQTAAPQTAAHSSTTAPATTAPQRAAPTYLPGRFIPAARKAGVASLPALASQPHPLPPVPAVPAAVSPVVASSTATSFSRSSVAAAQVVAATTRRSVLARHANRPRRAGGGR